MSNTQTNGASRQSNYQDRERVAFVAGEPVTLTLEFDQGQLTQGRFGDEFRYWVLVDGVPSTMWVAPKVAAMIEAHQAKAGDVLRITKREKKNGSRKAIEWDVFPVSVAALKGKGSPAPVDPVEEEPEGLNTPWDPAEESHGNAARGAMIPRPPAQPIPAPVPQAQAKTERDRIMGCLCNAIDMAALGSEYARGKGLMIAFSGEDVRSLAITEYIQLCKGGAR